MRKLLILVAVVALAGCVMPDAYKVMEGDYQREFTYDYQVQGVDKDGLWKRARDHIASTFGDSKEVVRVSSMEEGTIMGKGVARWYLVSTPCLASYEIRFMAKDERARLQLELTTAAAPGSQCPAWHTPTAPGYESIKAEFESLQLGLGIALKSGSKMDKLKDF